MSQTTSSLAGVVPTGTTGQITTSFWWKKLHSLSGIIPVGVFLLEHIWTNSYAVHGEQAFNKAVENLRSLPYVVFIEIGLIGIPILFHAIYGLIVTLQSRPNNLRYGHLRNWMYLVQRISGIFLIAYIVWHVWRTRVGFVVKGVPMDFNYMVNEFTNPGIAGLYAVGMLSAVFHFANGLWSFLIGWGIITSEHAMKRAAYLCAALGVLLAAAGINGLLGFFGMGFMLNI